MEFCDHLLWLKNAPVKITHFQSSGAFFLDAAMSAEQTHQRLGVAEGVSREFLDLLQRVSVRHQAAHEALQTIHQELSRLRSRTGARSRIRFVKPKSRCQIGSERRAAKVGEPGRTWQGTSLVWCIQH